jgi:hypothetical protein
VSDPGSGGTSRPGRGVHDSEMTTASFVPDDVIEAIVDGRPVEPPYADLAGFAQQVRALGDGPARRPSAELAALLRGKAGASPIDYASPRDTGRRRRLAAKAAGLGLVAKIGLGTSLAAASVAGAGTAGVLPDAANDTVRRAIEAVSPLDFDDGSTDEPAPTTSSPTSPDATDTTAVPGDGESGSTIADGTSTADHPGSNAVAEPPGQAGGTGLTRANETPAEPHAPDTTPTTSPHPTPSSTTPASPPDGTGHTTPSRSAPSTVPAAYGDRAGDHDNDG